MNKTDIEPLFPERLTDEAAAALSAFLHDLADACESRYFTQLRRHHAAQQAARDHEQPWRAQNQGRQHRHPTLFSGRVLPKSDRGAPSFLPSNRVVWRV